MEALQPRHALLAVTFALAGGLPRAQERVEIRTRFTTPACAEHPEFQCKAHIPSAAVAGRSVPERFEFFVNGVWNQPKDAELSAARLANALGVPVLAIYNSTEDAVKDVVNAGVGMSSPRLGMERELAARTLAAAMTHLLREHPEAKISIHAHSQGAIIADNALHHLRHSPPYRDMSQADWASFAQQHLELRGYGPAKKHFHIPNAIVFGHKGDSVASFAQGVEGAVSSFQQSTITYPATVVLVPEGAHELATYIESIPKFLARELFQSAGTSELLAKSIVTKCAAMGLGDVARAAVLDELAAIAIATESKIVFELIQTAIKRIVSDPKNTAGIAAITLQRLNELTLASADKRVSEDFSRYRSNADNVPISRSSSTEAPPSPTETSAPDEERTRSHSSGALKKESLPHSSPAERREERARIAGEMKENKEQRREEANEAKEELAQKGEAIRTRLEGARRSRNNNRQRPSSSLGSEPEEEWTWEALEPDEPTKGKSSEERKEEKNSDPKPEPKPADTTAPEPVAAEEKTGPSKPKVPERKDEKKEEKKQASQKPHTPETPSKKPASQTKSESSNPDPDASETTRSKSIEFADKKILYETVEESPKKEKQEPNSIANSVRKFFRRLFNRDG